VFLRFVIAVGVIVVVVAGVVVGCVGATGRVSSLLGMLDIVVVLVLVQELHKQFPCSPHFVWASEGTISVRCSEKKRSPLSGASISAWGNGYEHPSDLAMLLMHHNSLWLKNGTTFSHAAGIFRRLICFSGGFSTSFVDTRALTCRIVRLHLAVPARFRLSARLSLIPQFAK